MEWPQEDQVILFHLALAWPSLVGPGCFSELHNAAAAAFFVLQRTPFTSIHQTLNINLYI